MKLVIVESPTKAKTIENYLGNGYKVVSTKGAMRDLAYTKKGGYGVDIENDFQPDYIVIDGKGNLVKELKKLKKEFEVILATDPDREGEAIAWHVADILGLDLNTQNRVAFQEITKKAIQSEINNLRKIDINLVKAQEVRRIIDRIIGFSLSKIVQTKIGGRSAGRVQSVALKLVVDLEKEIKQFVPQNYFQINAYKPIDGKTLDVENNIYLFEAEYQNKKELEIDEAYADKVLKEAVNPFKVKEIKEHIAESRLKIPFITSTIQQESFNRYGYTTKKTMLILQNLFEGKKINDELTGLITYIRTDSARLSEDFIKDASEKIVSDFGKEYLKGYSEKTVKGQKIQDAHEAIRPSNLSYTPEYVKDYLEKDEYLIYKLIYERTLSSLMMPSKTIVKDYFIESHSHIFKMQSRKNIFKGNQIFDKIVDTNIPDYKKDDLISDVKVLKLAKQTKHKTRYTEASLIKKLEEEGIGRPSTYSTIINALKSRDYVLVEKRYFIPTELGILTSDRLQEYFNKIINISYTSNLEKELDMIADGKCDYLSSLKDFYKAYEELLKNATTNMTKSKPISVGKQCPNCGSDLIYRNSKYGQFIGCSNYPNCNYIEKIKKVGVKYNFKKNKKEE